MYLIFGLGNPGRRYAHSRHNMGFEAIDLIARDHEIRIKESKFAAFAGEGFIGSEKIVLVKPATYMNRSGEAVRDLVRWYKMEAEDFAARLIVIYDDIDLPLGKIRIRERGGAGGHNGMKSILYHLETEDFLRIRVGVGGKPDGGNLSAHVLGKVDKEDEAALVHGIIAAAAAVEDIVRSGVGFAMNKYNPAPKANKEIKEEKKDEDEASGVDTAVTGD
jgi:PTH1 family peptidyl-tRNA hydrolase